MSQEVLSDRSESREILKRCGIYLINLERSVDRLKSAEYHFNKIGLAFYRIDAIDASRTSMADYPIDREAFRLTHGRSTIRPGEVGCYFSHLKALQTFIDSDKQFGIIFEDDALPENHLLPVLSTLLSWHEDWDIVSLFHFHRGGPVALRRTTEFSLAVHLGHISSAAAYLVNKKAAHQLIRHLAVMRACIDHSLYESWKHNLKLRSVLPMPVQLTVEANYSTINSDTGGKPPILFRVPTLVNRSYVAIRIFLSAVGQILKNSFKR